MNGFAIPLILAALTLVGCGLPLATGKVPSAHSPRAKHAAAMDIAMAAGLDEALPAFGVPISGGRPVVLVPGYLDASWYFKLIENRVHGLKRSTHMLPLFPNISDITGAAKRLRAHVEKVKQDTGYDQVDIIAHSEGGLIARQFVKFEGGAAQVGRFVSLAVPHHGTILGYLGPGRGADQMQPGSDFLKALNDPDESHGDITYTSIRGNLDEIIVPHASMIQAGATNVEVSWIEHASILTSARVWTHIAAGLQR